MDAYNKLEIEIPFATFLCYFEGFYMSLLGTATRDKGANLRGITGKDYLNTPRALRECITEYGMNTQTDVEETVAEAYEWAKRAPARQVFFGNLYFEALVDGFVEQSGVSTGNSPTAGEVLSHVCSYANSCTQVSREFNLRRDQELQVARDEVVECEKAVECLKEKIEEVLHQRGQGVLLDNKDTHSVLQQELRRLEEKEMVHRKNHLNECLDKRGKKQTEKEKKVS